MLENVSFSDMPFVKNPLFSVSGKKNECKDTGSTGERTRTPSPVQNSTLITPPISSDSVQKAQVSSDIGSLRDSSEYVKKFSSISEIVRHFVLRSMEGEKRRLTDNKITEACCKLIEGNVSRIEQYDSNEKFIKNSINGEFWKNSDIIADVLEPSILKELKNYSPIDYEENVIPIMVLFEKSLIAHYEINFGKVFFEKSKIFLDRRLKTQL